MKINHVPVNSTGAVEKRRYGSGAAESNIITGNRIQYGTNHHIITNHMFEGISVILI